MKLSNQYFEDEVRSGFYVPAEMKRFWAVQMKVLEQIDDICTRHGIQWFADCGTLLGAVRHNGVIPWDDDFDIAMKREDFNRFTDIAIREIEKPYFVMSHKINGYWEVMTRITNGEELNYQHDHLREFFGCPYPTGIDIFPLDCVPPEEDAALVKEIMEIIFQMINETGPMFEEYDQDGPVNGNTRVSEEFLADIDRKCGLIENMTGMQIDRDKPIRMQLCDILEKIQSMYREEESTHVAILSIWTDNEKNKSLLKYYDGNVVNIPFEEGTIRVPAAYDAILKSKYGDYMKPVRQWDFHDYPLYDSQYQTMVDAGVGPRRYAYDAKELENTGRESLRTYRQNALCFMQMALKVAEQAVEAAKSNNNELACQMLTDLQNGVIEIGNLLEKNEGEDCPAISMLECICERIYDLYSAISQPDIIEATGSALIDAIINAEGVIDRKLKQKREVVFLVSRLSAWPYMENLWLRESNEPNTDVYVIPLQYIYKDEVGAAREICYEMDRMPANITLTNVDSYDFANRHPDIIYTHDHFEKENVTLSIHPAMYAGNLRKYTEQLVYVPAFTVDEYNEQDGRACRMMQEYVCMPGIVHADRVLVRSEQTRKGYLDTLIKWAGEDTKEIWEEKIVVDEAAFEGAERRKIVDIPKEWQSLIIRPDQTKKKVILFSNGTSTLLEYGEQMIHKIERVLQTFEDAKENVVLIWCPHPKLRDALIGENPELWEQFKAIVQEYTNQGWGILDLGEDLDTVIGIADAYYGDTGSIPQRFRDMGKPVMLLSVEV